MLRGSGPKLIRENELQSRLLSALPGISHGFGTRAQPLAPGVQSTVALTQWKQVHGCAISEIQKVGQSCGEVDGFWSRTPQTPNAIVTADCVPILLARRDGKAVAALHAGWRGTFAQICETLFANHLVPAGQRPWEWIAAIGPCARECCYEVSPDLAQDFEKKFGKTVTRKKRYLDLVKTNLLQLQKIGVEEVDTQAAQCTICSRDEAGQFAFHSFRRDGSGGRQYSWITINPTL